MVYRKIKLLCFSFLAVLFFACSGKQEPASADFLKAKDLFMQASDFYHAGDYAKAETKLKKCVDVCLEDENRGQDSILELMPRAMGQLMNSYQGAGEPEKCILYFEQLRNNVGKYDNLRALRRDVQVLLAYSLSRTERTKEAALVMDSALAMPLYRNTPENVFRDYAYASAVYFCIPDAQQKVLKCGNRALAAAKESDKNLGVQWLVALMGSLYQRTGDISSAINMYEEGYAVSAQARDTLAMVDMERSTADFLLHWHMADEAANHADNSVKLLKQLRNPNPLVATMAYLSKAKSLMEQDKEQEALQYLRIARQTCKGLPYNSGNSDVDVAMGSILVNQKGVSKTYQQGLAMLAKAAKEATCGIRSMAYYEMARGLIEHGDNASGEMALDSMYHYLNIPPAPSIRDDAYQYALNHYLLTQNKDKVMLYAKAISQLKIQEQNKSALRTVTRTLVRMETAKKNEILRQNALAERQRELRYRLGVGALFAILLGLIVLFINRWKKYRRKHSAIKEALQTTAKDMEKTVKENRKIKKQLRNLEQKDEKKLKEGVSLPEILTDKGDEHFREMFSNAYPYFIPTVQKQALEPLTGKELLLGMVMALGKDNLEIADMFHITRKSLNMAKYRMRKKFNLADGQTLEDLFVDILKRAQRAQKKA